MNKLKKIVSAAAASALIFAAPVAFATDATQIVNSGDNATVNTTANQNSTVHVNNTNSTEVSQTVDAYVNTGNNTADKNIGTGTAIQTGDAGLTTNFAVDANKNTTVVGQTNPVSNNLTDVTNTGDHALVNTSTNTNSSVQVDNTNYADISQMVDVKANTGNNKANSNIGGAFIGTGQAGIGVNMQTQLNKNETVVGDPFGMDSSGSVNGTSITNTGDHATVNTSSNTNSSVEVRNGNMAYILQMLDANANSGYNRANSNIGESAIMTGDAGITSNMKAYANTNLTGIGSGLGVMPHLANLNDFVNTGDYLLANTSMNSNTSTNIDNHNELLSAQFVHSYSNSGKNKTNSNIGGAFIGTIGSGASSNMSIGGNTNTTLTGDLFDSLLNLF